MSRKTNLIKELTQLSNEAGGSHLTREARAVTARVFAGIMREKNIQIRNAKSIGIKELRIFAEALQERGLSKRTIANRLSHLRSALASAGKNQMLKLKEASNKALGAAGGSRLGTHKPMSDAEYDRIYNNLQARDPQAAVIMELQRALGLRQQEALRGATKDNLQQWEKQLKEGYVRVDKGTKGGRVRETLIKSHDRALKAVQNALKSIEKGSDVVMPASSYKVALDRLKNGYRKSGMVGQLGSHSLRYAWAKEQHQAYLNEGMNERQARVELSRDLGHGDGRGRYISMVYLRK